MGPTHKPAPGSHLLALADIWKRYDATVALSGASLEIERGEIHALLGENGAGKTTLMNVLDGITRPDSGTITWSDTEVEIDSPKRAASLGIGMVHQHDRLVPALAVWENIALAVGSSFRISRNEIAEHLTELTERYGGVIDPDALVSDLSVGERQWVSLLRALAGDVKLLVLDEPTSTLTPIERDRLFAALRHYRAAGLSVIFITHKLDEVFALCDRVTVMRGGETVSTVDVASTTQAQLVQSMVGRPVDTDFDRAPSERGEILLQVDSLSVQGARQTIVELDLEVSRGEVVGIAGVDGNGQGELIEVICGVREAAEGTVIFGDETHGWHHGRAASVARIPEDRHRHGLALGLPLWENVHLGRFRNRGLVRNGFLNRRGAHEASEAMLEAFDVRCSGPDQPSGELSGGNQQKAVLARELSDDPDLVVAMNPCRGLDIGAARFVLDQLVAVRDRNGGVLFVSYDLDEILAISDRILVMASGRIAGELKPGPDVIEQIGLLMGGAEIGVNAQ
ncbi:MAG: ABC transporter ATP-binding protein [Acidimicrobiales bacterium]